MNMEGKRELSVVIDGRYIDCPAEVIVIFRNLPLMSMER